MKKLITAALTLALCLALAACGQLVPIMPGTSIGGDETEAPRSLTAR